MADSLSTDSLSGDSLSGDSLSGDSLSGDSLTGVLSTNDVRDIARLARLDLTDAELEDIRGDLSAILSHMDALRALDTQGVAPMTHAVPATRPLRDDVVEASLDVDVALAQAPEHADDHFQVPNILETQAGE